MSSTAPGMSIVGAPVISCSISAIGNSGARSSGPTGSLVPGCNGGCSGSGRSGSALYQAVGILSCASTKRVSTSRPPIHGRGPEVAHQAGRIVGAYEGFADEHRIEPYGTQPGGVLERAHRRLRDGDHRRGDPRT